MICYGYVKSHLQPIYQQRNLLYYNILVFSGYFKDIQSISLDCKYQNTNIRKEWSYNTAYCDFFQESWGFHTNLSNVNTVVNQLFSEMADTV